MHSKGGDDQIVLVSAPGEQLYKPGQRQSRNAPPRAAGSAAPASAADSKFAEAQDHVTTRRGAAETEFRAEA
jgi:hypothetical protein